MGAAVERLDYEAMGEADLAACIAGGDRDAARLLVRRNNQRLFRAAWSVVKNRAEAEEVVQEAYLKAFAGIGEFRGGSALSTWLTRIVVNEAINRVRAAKRRSRAFKEQGLSVIDDYRDRLSGAPSLNQAPDEALARRQLSALLERAIARLPEPFRLVFVLREVEGLSAEAVAEAVGAPLETVRTRLFRARRRLQADLGPELKRTLETTVAFAGADCDALTERVIAALERAGLVAA